MASLTSKLAENIGVETDINRPTKKL